MVVVKKTMLNKIKILLVDADIHMARVVVQNLRAMGFENLHHVKTGLLALEYMQNNPVDIFNY